jgi:hypothetical protein
MFSYKDGTTNGGLAHAFTNTKNGVPCPSRVLCERAGLFADIASEGKSMVIPKIPDEVYPALSSTFREIAVTSLRGPIRTDSASNQFRNPEITSVLPAIKAR